MKDIKNKIVWKIYFVWLFKRIIPLFILELVLLILIFYFLGKLVFVQKVFENALLASMQNPILLASYMLRAFLGTSLVKQVVIVGILGMGVLFMRDIGRAIASYISTSRILKR